MLHGPQPLLSIAGVSKAMVAFFLQRALNEICGCEMWSFELPYYRVSPVKSDLICADVVGQYLAPPATSTRVSPCQQRYG